MSRAGRTDRPTGRATIVDIAREIGVSPATVSNALNGRRYVDAETKDRIKKTADRLGYRPNLRAQRLRTGGVDTIALYSSMPFAIAAGPSRLGFLMEIAAVAAAAALNKGMALVLVPPLENSESVVDGLAIDGAIVVEPEAHDRTVQRLRAAGLPVVSIGRQPGSHDVPYVDLHSGSSTDILLEHLAEQNTNHIALVIGSAERNSYIEAEAAYARFIGHRKRKLILRLDEAEGEDGASRAVAELLDEVPEIDGLCVPVDAFAVGAVLAATQRGKAIPEDIKLVTRYDGLRARQTQPNLTALDLHLDQVAALAVDLLMERVRTGSGKASVAGPMPLLIPRGSSVAPQI